MIKTIASLIVSMAMLTALGTVVAPEATAHAWGQVPSLLDELTQPDCETEAYACLKRKGEKLQAQEDDLDLSAAQLEMELQRAKETLESNKRLRQQNAVFAEKMKSIFQAYSGFGPITFAGEVYPDATAFMDQATLLRDEGQRLQGVGANAQALVDRLTTARRSLISRKSEIRATIAMIPSQLKLLEVDQRLETLNDVIAEADKVLKQGIHSQDDINRLLRNTEELVAADVLVPNSNADIEAWLNEGITAN